MLKVLQGHTDSARAVAISTDGSKIVSGSFDNTVRVWSTETGEVLCADTIIRTEFSWAGS